MLQEIKIEQTKYSPKIYLREGNIHFEGRSVLNDPYHFYQPVFSWIERYIDSDPKDIRIDLKFEYINTSSVKWIFEMLKTFLRKPELKKQLNINWYYEDGDDDMQELGEILKSIMNSSFHIIKIRE
ncbi:MAG TPA: DUF1987 domain-containing protein [Bacteroidetes bacterium]|nr:DUF1987 domain-containing protein [Bacteroidota bacterium]